MISGTANYFIPTRNATEYNSFVAVAPSKGISIGSCAVAGDGLRGLRGLHVVQHVVEVRRVRLVPVPILHHQEVVLHV
jgi:hypothetical protein